jgi:hypothetical protein
MDDNMSNPEIIKVDENRWQEAQKFEMEFAQQTAQLGDDYNHWWYAAFGNYQVIRNLALNNVLEVGCGPHTNIRLILPQIQCKNLWLEDPLINSYQKIKETNTQILHLHI